MKKMLLALATVVALGLSFQSCQSGDQKIMKDVQKMITNDYRNVAATVNNGVVTLTGTVESQQTRSNVESTVRTVKNVKSVINNIVVNNPSSAGQSTMYQDDVMRTTISSALNTEGFRDVRVDVRDGEVTLNGELNRSDLTRVMQIANETNPRRVTNNLTLK